MEKLENDTDRAAREGRREQPGAAGKLGEAATAIRDQRVRDKIDFSKNVMRSGSMDYANAFEDQIGENLKDVADKVRAAAGALGNESATRGQEKALERTRELVRGMESLRQRVSDRSGKAGKPGEQGQGGQGTQSGETGQPGRGGSGGNASRLGNQVSAGDARQFSREVALRRQNAESLRKELVKQGVNVGDLDRAIDEMRRLETSQLSGDFKGVDELQKSVIEGLKTFEFSLYRKLGLGDSKSPTLGSSAPVPAEYRAAVEEYYRSLAGARRKP